MRCGGNRAFLFAGPQVRNFLPLEVIYVGSVSSDCPHSNQDVSVDWVISWHSTHLTFFVSTHCLWRT